MAGVEHVVGAAAVGVAAVLDEVTAVAVRTTIRMVAAGLLPEVVAEVGPERVPLHQPREVAPRLHLRHLPHRHPLLHRSPLMMTTTTITGLLSMTSRRSQHLHPSPRALPRAGRYLRSPLSPHPLLRQNLSRPSNRYLPTTHPQPHMPTRTPTHMPHPRVSLHHPQRRERTQYIACAALPHECSPS